VSSYLVHRDQCSQRSIFPGVNIHTCAGDQMMLSLVEFEAGAVVEWHSHPHEQMGMLLEGELEFWVGDEHAVARPGDMWRIPGGVPHKVVAGDRQAKALDVFHPVREDYR